MGNPERGGGRGERSTLTDGLQVLVFRLFMRGGVLLGSGRKGVGKGVGKGRGCKAGQQPKRDTFPL